MPIMVAIPDDCKPLADAITQLVARTEQARHRASGGRAVEYGQIERDVGADTAAVERAAHQSILAAFDVDAPTVIIDGRVHTRVFRSEGRYYTMAGDVVVPRSLYRATRNGTVVDPISLRVGAVAGGWLPETAAAMGHLLQQGTSREAEDTARRVGRVPYSRSSFEDVGHAVGQLYTAKKTAIDDALIVALEIPSEARSVSVGMDRVSIPLEEPRPRPVGRPRTDAPTRPVQRVFRMAYCTTVTFHDATGEAVHTIRYGAVPTVDPVDLCDRVLADAVAIRAQRPDLRFVALCDGAPEMRTLLRSALDATTLGTPVYELLDVWHLLEKLGAAAQVLYGEVLAKEVLARWRVDLLNRTAAPDDILHTLRHSAKRQIRVGDTRPVHDAITYIENHRELLGYPGARRRGLPIGSGNTEATCKSLFTMRVKRCGARWKEATVGEVINLRALALSDRWDHAIRLTLAPLRTAVRAAA
ncbi:MAG TPA: ISKra4 family transposase [Vicinamibacterales bacterium]|nr:ISKra4 family transposase [Vicinamibacterales bacterium]